MFVVGQANADSFEAEVRPMLEASCLSCHGEGTLTSLNMQEQDAPLSDLFVTLLQSMGLELDVFGQGSKALRWS